MSSRSLDDLHPIFRPMARAFVAAAMAADLEVLIYCTLRDSAEQNELYAHGRTKPGPIVTNARGGQSAHNYGMAFDGVPMLHGKPMWDQSHPLWKTYGEMAAAAGAEWAGTWISFVEFPHVQHPQWKVISGVT